MPRSKPVRFTEYGCAAVTKAPTSPTAFRMQIVGVRIAAGFPREPGRFHPDAVISAAQHAFWTETANNPESPIYGGRCWTMHGALPGPGMLALSGPFRVRMRFGRMARITSRPLAERRAGSVPLDAGSRDICADAGVLNVATDRLHGAVLGFAAAEVASARPVLQPLAMVHGFDPVEDGGVLSFLSRAAADRKDCPAGRGCP